MLIIRHSKTTNPFSGVYGTSETPSDLHVGITSMSEFRSRRLYSCCNKKNIAVNNEACKWRKTVFSHVSIIAILLPTKQGFDKIIVYTNALIHVETSILVSTNIIR